MNSIFYANRKLISETVNDYFNSDVGFYYGDIDFIFLGKDYDYFRSSYFLNICFSMYFDKYKAFDQITILVPNNIEISDTSSKIESMFNMMNSDLDENETAKKFQEITYAHYKNLEQTELSQIIEIAKEKTLILILQANTIFEQDILNIEISKIDSDSASQRIVSLASNIKKVIEGKKISLLIDTDALQTTNQFSLDDLAKLNGVGVLSNTNTNHYLIMLLIKSIMENGENACRKYLDFVARIDGALTPSAQLLCAIYNFDENKNNETREVLEEMSLKNSSSIAFALMYLLQPKAWNTIDDGLLSKLINQLVEWLASRPEEKQTRIDLCKLFDPKKIGQHLIAIFVSLIFEEFSKIKVLDKAKVEYSLIRPEELISTLKNIQKWIDAQNATSINELHMPLDVISSEPEIILNSINRFLETSDLHGTIDETVSMLEMCLGQVVLLSEHLRVKNLAYYSLKLIASKFNQLGRSQRARDLAESSFELFRDNSPSHSHAWFVFADIYLRQNNIVESLVALYACLKSSNQIEVTDYLYISELFCRILRNSNLTTMALEVAEQYKKILSAYPQYKGYLHRMETFALWLRFREITSNNESQLEDFSELGRNVCENLANVLAAKDEIAPSAVLLAQIIQLARKYKLDDGSVIDQLNHFEALIVDHLHLINTQNQTLINSFLSENINSSVSHLKENLKNISIARYGEDIGNDILNQSVIARNILDSADKLDPRDVLFLSELCTDMSHKLEDCDETEYNHGNIYDSLERNIDFALNYTINNLAIFVVALNRTNKIVCTKLEKGKISYVKILGEEHFDIKKYKEWHSNGFPFNFTSLTDISEFYSSMEGVSICEIDQNCILVADRKLQNIPANLIRIDGELAGMKYSITSAPSLSWLRSCESERPTSNKKIKLWIPFNEEEDTTPLSIIRSELIPHFQAISAECDFKRRLPKNMNGSEIAIIVAHGGLKENNLYFSTISDDNEGSYDIDEVTTALQSSKIVIFLACSGGRIDENRLTNSTTSFVKLLLDKGVKSVIAPTWPINIHVPTMWLPFFLHYMFNGKSVSESAFLANIDIAYKTSHDCSRAMALSIYGSADIKLSL